LFGFYIIDRTNVLLSLTAVEFNNDAMLSA